MHHRHPVPEGGGWREQEHVPPSFPATARDVMQDDGAWTCDALRSVLSGLQVHSFSALNHPCCVLSHVYSLQSHGL